MAPKSQINFVEQMEKKQKLKEEQKRKERIAAEEAARNKQRSAEEEAEIQKKARRTKQRDFVLAQPFDLKEQEQEIRAKDAVKTSTTPAEEWWAEGLAERKRANDGNPLWVPSDGTPRPEMRHLVDEYGGKSVPSGYRGFKDDPPAEAAMNDLESFEDMMTVFKAHEKDVGGRTSEAKGTERGRPDHFEAPAAAFRWVEQMRSTPQRLIHELAEERAKSAIRFADQSEEITEAEAGSIIELGVIQPLLKCVEEAEDEEKPDGIYIYLQQTKTGTPTEMIRHTQILHISFTRTIRNLTCALLRNYNLQPRQGCQGPGTIEYDWIPGKHAAFIDIVATQPGVYDLLLRMLTHESDECKEHSLCALTNIASFSQANKMTVLNTEDVLETLRLLLLTKSGKVQDAAADLLVTMIQSEPARIKFLRFRGRRGVTYLPTLVHALHNGSDLAKGHVARLIWYMTLSHEKLPPRKHAHEHLLSKKEKKKKKKEDIETVQEALKNLGDGIKRDFVKQDICREPELLGGLGNLLENTNSYTQEMAIGAVWSLSVERANKRMIAQEMKCLHGISDLIENEEASPAAKRYCRNTLRNLATDLWVMDHLSTIDAKFVRQLLKECDVHMWQLAIVAPPVVAFGN